MDKADAPDPTIRLRHLKETFLKNIQDNTYSNGPDVEFVVLDYNSIPDLADWVLNDPDLTPHLDAGVVKYFRTEEPEYFHMAHAKNMSHRLATGEVLCNLDADNFLGSGFASYLENVFTENPNAILNPSLAISKKFPADERGFFGRIAILRENFEKLHGYDESFEGWGYEDTDFMQRAKGLGLKHMRIDRFRFIGVIGHSNEDRVANMVSTDCVSEASQAVDELKNSQPLWQKFARKALVLMRPVQVNNDGKFGLGAVSNETGEIIHLKPMPAKPIQPFNVCAVGLPEMMRGRFKPRIAELRIDGVVPERLASKVTADL